MKKNGILWMFAMLMLTIGMSSCSNDDDSIDDPSDNVLRSGLFNDELVFFMTDALYKSESAGLRTFFSESMSFDEDKCLIINSEQAFREAYKGDKELPVVDFSQYTLIIGRTWGNDSSFSLDHFEMTDDGSNYQINVTLNRNINPNLGAYGAITDIFFWRLYPKMDSKPVNINRIVKEVNFDPEGDDSAYTRIRNRWILESYTDADGTPHQVGEGWGDNRFAIQFKENGRVEGQNNRNSFEGFYMLSYTNSYTSDLNYSYIDLGIINLRDIAESEVYDNDPIARQFRRVYWATQFELYGRDYLRLRISPKEYFVFRHEALKSYISPKVQDTQCYTIRINGIDEDGIVSGSIINKPEESSLSGHCIILFEKTDLSGLNVENNDEIDVKILSFKEASVEGFTTGETHFYYCKINLCK